MNYIYAVVQLINAHAFIEVDVGRSAPHLLLKRSDEKTGKNEQRQAFRVFGVNCCWIWGEIAKVSGCDLLVLLQGKGHAKRIAGDVHFLLYFHYHTRNSYEPDVGTTGF